MYKIKIPVGFSETNQIERIIPYPVVEKSEVVMRNIKNSILFSTEKKGHLSNEEQFNKYCKKLRLWNPQNLYICEDSQSKLIPASVTEDDIINIESVAISINKMEDIIIKLRKTNSYLISAIKVHTLHSTCGKELFRNSISKQNVVTLNSSCVHVLDNLILPT